MYNRYIPQPDGSYQRSRVQEPKPSPPQQHTQTRQPSCEHQKKDCQKEDPRKGACPEHNTPQRHNEPQRQSAPQCHNEPQRQSVPQSTNLSSFFRQFLPGNFETGDLIVVLLLLLMAGDNQENRNNALLTMALYFLM